jgi:SAM-dependent methyltransferase
VKRKLPPWLLEYFDEHYLRFVLEEIPPERTLKQVNFLLPFLPSPESGPILDIGCGIGRHSLLLAKMGYRVVGIDVIPAFIRRALEDAEKEGVSCEFKVQDMRALKEQEVYAAALFFWSSFGYFQDEENQQVLLGVREALKPGGFLFLDLENRDYILRHFQGETWKDKKTHFILERNRFDPTGDLLITKKIYLLPTGRREAERQLKLYPYTTVARFLQEREFLIDKIFGSWSGEPFTLESQRMLILAHKP